MAKKLISVWLALTILLLSSVPIYGEELTAPEAPAEGAVIAAVPETTHGHYFLRNININGQAIQNYNLEYPLYISNGATYIPMTGIVMDLLGLDINKDEESRTVTLTTRDPERVPTSDKLESNLEDAPLSFMEGYSIQGQQILPPEETTVLTELMKVNLPFLGGINLSTLLDALMKGSVYGEDKLDTEELPLLEYEGVIYLPVKALTGENGLGWDAYYDEYYGLCISTDPEIPAATYCSQEVSNYNKGLTAYIRKFNKTLTAAQAQELVFIFRHEADVYDENLLMLMAMAMKESRFYADAVNKSSGATGLMQIMPATAIANGYTPEQMLDAHTNIQFGAMYISNHKDNYNGDIVLALCAYAQGGGAVNRGQYNTRYATRVTDAQAEISRYLSENGYTK